MLTYGHNTRYYAPMYIHRVLTDTLQKTGKSLFLLGPRQTGKSTLVKKLKPDIAFNLMDEQIYLDFASNPSELRERLGNKNSGSVFIDEIQRLPSLLNTVQTILDENKRIKFFLTGSSARKLKRGKANLLPGRIHTYHLGPLIARELDYQMNAITAMEIGTLPGFYQEESREIWEKTLRSYAATYLKEEIQAESLTRNLEGFSRFLYIAAQWAGNFVDITQMASEAQISRQSAMRYFEILEETLVVDRCSPFAKNLRKRLVQHPKFYFFDTGVLNALLKNFSASSDRRGNLFEHFMWSQIMNGARALDTEIHITSYRTEHGAEVDFIVEKDDEIWAVELKASSNIGKGDLSGLRSFAEFYGKKHNSRIAYLGNHRKKIENTTVLPWIDLLKELGF